MGEIPDHGDAIVLTAGLLQTPHAKVTHGLVRGPSRFTLCGVVDGLATGQDAGELLDGHRRDIPIFGSLEAALKKTAAKVCIIGIATAGGRFTPELLADVRTAAEAGLTVINCLHQPLRENPHLQALAEAHGAQLVDMRRSPPYDALHFWSGKIKQVEAPRIAVLGTDCNIGKRTTCQALRAGLQRAGVRAEMVYTGQTGWLQGGNFGFILDATPNDFVSGELEHAILRAAATQPEVILLEGQSALRNPSGPCGSELIISGGARGVVLQHAPARRYHKGLEGAGCAIGTLADEFALIKLLGASVWAIAINDTGLTVEERSAACAQLHMTFGVPVVFALQPAGADALATACLSQLAFKSCAP